MTGEKNLSKYNNWFKDLKNGNGCGCETDKPEDGKILSEGMVQVYTGNGKGKTTAALGQALRASGHNMKSLIIQFLKGGSYTGEFKAISDCLPLIKIIQTGRPFFVNKKKVSPRDLELNRKGFETALEVSREDNGISILVLDEINVAVNLEIISAEEVVGLIRGRRKNLELILTGRNAPKEIMDAADLVTEMKEIKHYFSYNGTPSRTGIEK